MQAHKDFIVHIPERYKSTMKTKSGFELELDKRFSGKELANNIFEVVNVPINYKGEIKTGCRLAIDPIVVHNQMFEKFGEEENQYLVDKKKCLYRIDPSLIVCYSMGVGTEFKGFENNLLCEKYEVEEKEPDKIGSVYIPDTCKNEVKDTCKLKVFIGNEALEDEGVYKGDVIFHQPYMAIDIKLRDMNLIWLRNHHVIGKYLKENA